MMTRVGLGTVTQRGAENHDGKEGEKEEEKMEAERERDEQRNLLDLSS